MPWKIERGHSSCPTSRPYAVVKEDDGDVEGCHSSRAGAIRQQRALYASEASAEEDILSDEIPSLAEADMADTNGMAVVEEEAIEELAAEDELDVLDAGREPIAWSGPIALEGMPTGDSGMKRYLMPGSVGWRDLPMTLMAQFANEEGHGGAVVAGRIDSLERMSGPDIEDEYGEGVTVIWGEGVFDSGESGQEAARMVGDQVMRGISIDLTDSVWKIRDPEDNALYAVHDLPMELAEKFFADELQMALESGKIGAATIVPIPALEDANVAIAASATQLPTVYIDIRPDLSTLGIDEKSLQVLDHIETLKAGIAELNQSLMSALMGSPTVEDEDGHEEEEGSEMAVSGAEDGD